MLRGRCGLGRPNASGANFFALPAYSKTERQALLRPAPGLDLYGDGYAGNATVGFVFGSLLTPAF
jgi:hypothetical protein